MDMRREQRVWKGGGCVASTSQTPFPPLAFGFQSLSAERERGPRPRHHPPAESLSPCLLHLHTMRRRDIPVVGGRECSPPQRIFRMSFNMAAHRNYGTERAGERANRRERNARPPIFLLLPFRAGRMLGGNWEEEEGNVCVGRVLCSLSKSGNSCGL